MKKLMLIRHAKASTHNEEIPDLQRCLTPRGLQNIKLMSDRLMKTKPQFDQIYSSPAERANNTARGLASALGFKKKQIIIAPELYTFSADDLLVWLRQLDKSVKSLVIVGHNPAMTDVINFLALTNLENLPTCGMAEMQLAIKHWTNLVSGCAELLNLDYPKKAKKTYPITEPVG